ncbi:helix-turn-helix domain-containing protein [Ligilactobacillus apodemi]|uniref:helix-turn-helix domain-containing protein n=1 Tax=Ligilactobacillus apodemi TaxID=307126 RepID=UPI00214BFD3E|nr:helix-turn-helix domain-containing protein [Ligilactobacillus apodemi]MCR1900675.1 helix-turn-helix domain-containing protein [Ligilactobacillus apodemi]
MKQKISELIKEYRKKRGLTQQELAEGICTQAIISKIEKGITNPSVDIFSALCQRLAIPSERILQFLEVKRSLTGSENVFAKEYRQLYYERNYQAIKFFLEHLLNYDELPVDNKYYYDWLRAEVTFYYEKEQQAGLKALETVYKAVMQADRPIKLKERIIQTLADMNYHLERYDIALELYTQIIDEIMSSESVEFKALGLHGLAKLYQKLGDLTRASEYVSLEIDTLLAQNSLYNLGEAFLLFAKLLSEQGMATEAKANCQKVINICDLTNNNSLKSRAVAIIKNCETSK